MPRLVSLVQKRSDGSIYIATISGIAEGASVALVHDESLNLLHVQIPIEWGAGVAVPLAGARAMRDYLSQIVDQMADARGSR